MRYFLAAVLLLAIAAIAEANFCSTLTKGGGKQPLKTCKPFRDGVCDAVTSPPCSDKLCETLKADDGCALVDADALDAATRPVFGAFYIDLNDKPVDSCTAVPFSDKSDPGIRVFCSRIGPYMNIVRNCPTDGYGNGHPIGLGGTCGTQLGGPDGIMWDLPAFYSSDYGQVSCMFNPADIPPELQGGRILATVTCGREGSRPRPAGGGPPVPRNIKGQQIASFGGLVPTQG